jgi:hypothetical protein
MTNSSPSTVERLIYQFPSNVDIHDPKDAWGKFYSYVWLKHFRHSQNIQPSRLTKALQEEIKAYNGSVHYHGTSAWYYVVFSSEKDYTWFIMKWS